jgi:hypothetical protein
MGSFLVEKRVSIRHLWRHDRLVARFPANPSVRLKGDPPGMIGDGGAEAAFPLSTTR